MTPNSTFYVYQLWIEEADSFGTYSFAGMTRQKRKMHFSVCLVCIKKTILIHIIPLPHMYISLQSYKRSLFSYYVVKNRCFRTLIRFKLQILLRWFVIFSSLQWSLITHLKSNKLKYEYHILFYSILAEDHCFGWL